MYPSFIFPLTISLVHSFIHAVMYVHSFLRSFVRSFQSFSHHSSIHPLVHSSNHPSIHPPIHISIYPSIHPSSHPFIYILNSSIDSPIIQNGCTLHINKLTFPFPAIYIQHNQCPYTTKKWKEFRRNRKLASPYTAAPKSLGHPTLGVHSELVT